LVFQVVSLADAVLTERIDILHVQASPHDLIERIAWKIHLEVRRKRDRYAASTEQLSFSLTNSRERWKDLFFVFVGSRVQSDD
jgi:hypothetical protein